MNISEYIREFAQKNHKYKTYSKICKTMLLGGKPYSLNAQHGYEESEFLGFTIRDCVLKYSRNKDIAIDLFRDLVAYLETRGVAVPHIDFPPIPVSNTFERLMYIAKYLQEKDARIADLQDILWISDRQIETDLGRLRGNEDPIQVCGKQFYINETERRDGRITFQSTAHPLFLAENLTQVLIMLKGLKHMSEDPLYRSYAESTAGEIWNQLSPYAKKRIRTVCRDLIPDDYEWYRSLTENRDENHFHTENQLSEVSNSGVSVVLNCMKNKKSFCVEYQTDDGICFYKDCRMEENSYESNPGSIIVSCSAGRVRLLFDNVLRSAYTAEELAAE